MGAEAPLGLTLPIAVLLALPATAAAIAAIGGWTGRLRRAGRLGVHTLAATASDRGFEVANRVAAPVVTGAAAVGLLTALIVLLLPVDVLTAIVVGVLGLIGLLVLLYAAAALGERAARTVPLPARRPGTAGGFTCSAGAVDGPAEGGALAGMAGASGIGACGESCSGCAGAADCRIAALGPARAAADPSH
jgi:hypothetical protein